MRLEYPLYIHIPFCTKKCDYCAFYSEPFSARYSSETLRSYLNVLLFDIRSQIEYFQISCIPTVYIGGGTPSVIPPRDMEKFLAALRALLPGAVCEWTVEANPESVNTDFLRICKDHGVTRVSAGIQTFSPKIRQALNREGGARAVRTGIERIADIYAGNFSCDIISGLPGSDCDVLKNDIYQLLMYKPSGVSLYDLTPEEGTPLARKIKNNRVKLPPEDEAAEQWLLGRDMLRERGFEQYEVSNFALPGKRCRHNICYWRMNGWLGAGAAASGTFIDEEAAEGFRYTGFPGIEGYIKKDTESAGTPGAAGAFPFPAFYRRERLDRALLIRESVIMGFRYAEGPDAALFERRFGRPLSALIPQTLERWRKGGFIRHDCAALTPEGLALQNRFLLDALAELEFQGAV